MGAYAQQASVPAWKLVPVPQDVDFQTAAAVMLQGMTAHYLSHSTFRLEPGQRPVRVTLNLVVNGTGTVWIDEARLRARSLR